MEILNVNATCVWSIIYKQHTGDASHFQTEQNDQLIEVELPRVLKVISICSINWPLAFRIH